MATMALSPREELGELEGHLGSKAAIGRILGRDPAVVSRWMTKPPRLNRASQTLIDGAYAVVVCLVDRGYRRPDLEAVLTRSWPALNDRTPAELIAQREVARILEVLTPVSTTDERTAVPENTIAAELQAARAAGRIPLDSRLAGFGGYPAPRPEQINVLPRDEVKPPEPPGVVRGTVRDDPIVW
jgi:hypothetical protein